LNRTELEDYYVFIRMWCPSTETGEPDTPHFVRRLDSAEGQTIQWTLTQDFKDATLFKSENIAKRLVHSVGRLKHRIERGWLFEVVKVTEEVIDHNLPVMEEDTV
jgi:hypothetical protein